MRRILVVGTGSSHGDDQSGWQVIRRLRELLSTTACSSPSHSHSADIFEFSGKLLELREAQVPTDLLNWIDGQETLHIVDACELPNPGETQTVEFTSETRHTSKSSWRDVLETGRTLGGTHGFDILSVLDLACHLGTQPNRVRFWLVGGTAFEPSEDLSDAARHASHQTAERIREFLRGDE